MRRNVIPCTLLPQTKEEIQQLAEKIRQAAPSLAGYEDGSDEFWQSGLFGAAIERLRGQQAAATSVKYAFVEEVLQFLHECGEIADYTFAGNNDRHDFEISYSDGYRVAVETKGCLDGNNTNIFQRPPNADEFYIWSLCQNPGADPSHNVWSGIHTRLGANLIHSRQKVDAVIVWDMLCGTLARPCPKVQQNPARLTTLKSGRTVPPPCLYTFPRTIPDPRNNPNPRPWKPSELRFFSSLMSRFDVPESEVCLVGLEVRMTGAELERRTTFVVDGQQREQSGWTAISRSRT